MTLVPQVDSTICSAHGDCEDIAPEAFRVDDVAVVVGTVDQDLLLAAAEACPVTAIRVVDSQTGEQVYP
jgi:ferredoxin